MEIRTNSENQSASNDISEIFGEVVYRYTRQQAIEDGVLIDVTPVAKEAGIRVPVAVTASIWCDYIVPDSRLESFGQSIEGRLWDVIWMFRNHAQRFGADMLTYQVLLLSIGKDKDSIPKKRLVCIKAIISGGDHGEPVITLMRPDED